MRASRQPRGGGYNDLAREAAEPQHQPHLRLRCSVEAAYCAHDDPGALSDSLDLDVRIASRDGAISGPRRSASGGTARLHCRDIPRPDGE
jgi:hypothetical protein